MKRTAKASKNAFKGFFYDPEEERQIQEERRAKARERALKYWEKKDVLPHIMKLGMLSWHICWE